MRFLAALIFATLVPLKAMAQCPGSPPAGIDCVAAGASKAITAHSVCANITNNHASGKALMVPIATSTEWSEFRTKLPAGVTSGACGPVAPTSLVFTHSTRNRGFTVSWTAGSGNGGAGGCKIQYQKDGTTWTNVDGTYDCDSNAVNVAGQLPSTANWTNNFNATGVSMRLIRLSDSALMGNFTQKATCTATTYSTTSTPTIDENCNGDWDDNVRDSTTISKGAMTWNTAAGCAATATGDYGTSVDFYALQVGYVQYYYWGAGNTTCAGAETAYNATIYDMHFASSGFLPNGSIPLPLDNNLNMSVTTCQYIPGFNPNGSYRIGIAQAQTAYTYCIYSAASLIYY